VFCSWAEVGVVINNSVETKIGNKRMKRVRMIVGIL
jgi:hypothetical protein